MDAFKTLDFNQNTADNNQQWSEQLLQQFDIKGPLGKGGQGSVFLAHEYQLQRDVAIKRIIHQSMQDTLLAEAQAQAKIEHPNISKLFRVIQSNSPQQPNYLVMQYIEGQSALQWAQQQRSQCSNKTQWLNYIQRVVMMFRQVCDGLQALHNAGIIHRDIKPANIMVTEEQTDRPYIVDFGLAQPQQQSNECISGSGPFMSPEQTRGYPLSNSSDIYSLGMTLYQLLTAQLPQSTLTNSNLATTVDEHNTVKLPIELIAIIKKCLAYDRQNRYQTAQELSQELKRFLNKEAINTIDSTYYRMSKNVAKYRFVWLFILFIALIASSQLIWMQQQKLKQQKREQLIQQFHQTVQQAQYQSNLAYMAPPHDIRYLQQQHQQNLAQIIKQAQKLGPTAQPFALYAKGRIAQQQRDHLQAKQQLEAAWQQGFQTVESAYALVQVLNSLYQQALTQLYIMPRTALRTTQQALLKQQFVEPIIRYLQFISQQKQTNTSQAQQNYIQALLDYYQQNYQQAITQLSQINQFEPWQYHHYLLLGHSYLAQYQQNNQQHLLTQAEQAFDKALTIAPSDPNNYQQKWQLYITLVGNSQFGHGNTLASLNKAQLLLDKARQLNPAYLDTQANQIRTQFQRVVYLFNQAKPWQAALDKAQTQLEQALKQWPQHHKLLRLQTNILSWQLAHSQKTKQAQQYQAIEQLYQQLSDQQQLGFDDLIYSALHQKYWGDFLTDKQQAKIKYQAAAALFQQAIDSKPNYSGSYVNLALIQLKLSETDNNTLAISRLNQGIVQLNRALNLGYSEFIANYYLAKIRLEINNRIGSQNLETGIKQLNAGIKAIKKAQIAKPDNYHAIGLEIELISQLIENQWYLAKFDIEQATKLINLQLQRLKQAPEQLLALAHTSYVWSLIIKKQQPKLNPQWLQQHQDMTKRLENALALKQNQLNPQQISALSILLDAKMLQARLNQPSLDRQKIKSLERLLSYLKSDKTSADHYWTQANYYRLKAHMLKAPQPSQHQLLDQKTAITLWQKAHQLNPDRIRYHYSLIQGYLQYLMLIENSSDQMLIRSTIEQIKVLTQKLSQNTELYQFINTLLEQQKHGQLRQYLNQNRQHSAFAASILI